MLRVLLAVDDYGELLFLQTLLKKLGFDVDGIQSEQRFEEAFLALNPDMIIATAKGKRINGMEIAEGLRRSKGLPKVLLLASSAIIEKLRGIEIQNVDALLESPVGALSLLAELALHGGIDRQALIDKYKKLKATLSPEREADLQILRRDAEAEEWLKSGGGGAIAADQQGPPNLGSAEIPESVSPLKPSSMSEETRRERFKAMIDKTEKPQNDRFPRERIVQFHKDIRAQEQSEDTRELEEERQGFVKALFRKAKFGG